MPTNSNLGDRRVWLWQILGKLHEAGFTEARAALVEYYSREDLHKVCTVPDCKMNHNNVATDRCSQHFNYLQFKEVD